MAPNGWPCQRQGPHDLDLSDAGLRINARLVIRRHGTSYFPTVESDDANYREIEKISKMLERSEYTHAALYACIVNWAPERYFDVSIARAHFNQSEPRNWHGEWDGPFSDEDGNARVNQIQYNGRFHDAVVDDIMDFFRKDGSKVENNIKFTSLSGLTTITDFVSLPKTMSKGYLVEVKTGGDPPFTPMQYQVYPLLCIGGHVSSSDLRLSSLGLPVNTPLPAVDILVVYTSAPGAPVHIIDYCKERGLRP